MQRKPERKDQLLETAARLLKEEGYHKTSIVSPQVAFPGRTVLFATDCGNSI